MRLFNKGLVVGALVLSTLAIQKPAQAGLGIYLASNNANSTLGIVLAALGAGVAIDGLSSKPVNQQCTKSSPCTNVNMGQDTAACYDGTFSNNGSGCDEDGIGGNNLTGTYFTGTLTKGNYTYHDANLTQILIGLVLLGTDDATQANLLPVTSQMATEMKMTDKEATAYNESLTKINLIVNDFSTRLQQQATDSKMTKAEMKTAALTMWNTEAKPVLSTEAFSGAEKAGAAYAGPLNVGTN